MATIGLVTVLYKSDDLLEDFFKSIARQTYKEYILYLVDNSVSDATDSVIAECVSAYPVTEYRHIKNPDNAGVARGNNIGIHKALEDGCSHILLLNNDIDIGQDFVFSTMMSLSLQKNESIIVPKIYYYGQKILWMAGGYIDKWRALGVHYGFNKTDAPEFNIAKHVTYAPTCFMLIEKKVFEKAGYMDEKYFAYYDDVDFVLRAAKKGFKIYYEPAISIFHKVSSSAGANSPFYVYYSNRNKIYFIRKHFKGLNRIISLSYEIVSRVAFYLRFDKIRKQKLLQGIRDGFSMEVERK
jgi:GT2 family glycosyltransferase